MDMPVGVEVHGKGIRISFCIADALQRGFEGMGCFKW
jgi:hypothetical protein